MAVKPSSSPPRTGTRPAREGGGSRAVAILLSGVGVLVIAACAVVLSYNGIYQVAVQGGAEPPYAHLYPAVFTLLLLLAFWASFVLRAAPRVHRLQVDGLILVLILIAAGASALRASDQRLVDAVALVVVAAAPWVALLIAFLLFVRVWRHLHGELPDRRRAARRAPRPEERAAPLPAGTAVRAEERTGAEAADPEPEDAEPAPEPPAEKTATLLWPRAGARPLHAEPAEEDGPDTDPMPTVRVLHPAEAPPVLREGSSPAEGPGEGPEGAGARAEGPVRAGSEPRGAEARDAWEDWEEAEEAEGPDAVPEAEPLPDREEPAGEPDRADGAEEEEERDGEDRAEPAPASGEAAGPSVITAPTVPLRPSSAEEEEEEDAEDPEGAGPEEAGPGPAAPPEGERPPLPRRDPESGESAIRLAAESLGPLPAAGGPGAPSEDGAEDGFVDLLTEDDPTSDEAAPASVREAPEGAGPAEPAEPAESAEPSGAASAPVPPDASTLVAGDPPQPRRLPKRPMVLKPRRPPMRGFPPAPEAPPNSRVRSGPTPPDAPEDDGA
ncbi:DUF2637 domain-containing protein [Nocardiopsis sp. CNT-189]|uniref:DUF2637 domain-containing protein n=1 Tax=Nocardiopsis oceanisediminis TaxID=2816862 RepID=UPI003B3517C2